MGWAREFRVASTTGLCALNASSSDSPAGSAATFSADFPVTGDAPVMWERNLTSSDYLLETRERDVGIRMNVDTPGRHAELDDQIGRHRGKNRVVTQKKAGKVRVSLRNAEHPTMTGAIATRHAARFMEVFDAACRASGRAAEAPRIGQLRTRNGPAKAVWSSFVVRANELP
jgi:hypothetical protein